jgi:hypothetical protein
MVSLGFFDVAGQNDLPFVSADLNTSSEVQTSLLSFASALGPGAAGVRSASPWNLPLCHSCLSLETFPSAALYNQAALQVASRQLADSVATGMSTASAVEGWLAGPQGRDLGSSCWNACAPLPQTTNFYAGGFERPYAPPEGGRP